MTVTELRRIAHEADWFSRLGQFASNGGFVAVSAEEWRQLIAHGTALAFGLPWSGGPTLDVDWLPTTADEHADVDLEAQPDLRALRLELTRLALRSLRDRTEHDLLRVSRSDLRYASRGAAFFALREAAVEVIGDRPDYWASLVLLFAGGHWPFGRLPDSRTVVL